MSKLIFTIWTGASLGIALFLFLLSPVSETPQSQLRVIEISSGKGFSEIADLLKERGVIRSKKTFLAFGVLSGSAHKLKPGSYFLSPGSSTPAILRSIEKGPAPDVSVTFPEGATLKDVDAILATAGILPPGAIINFPANGIAQYEFLKDSEDLEGFLFPDTYRFFANSGTEQVLAKFFDNFEKKAWPLLRECQQASVECQMLGAKQILTVASLLEKEIPGFEDRRLVAGILYKRLRAGVGLNVDATIAYAKCGRSFITCGDPKVYRRDLEFQSTYNTYLNKGLPPGPIGNPGAYAIKAALDPAQSDYWYYLSDPETKKTIFSKTLDEHNDNRVMYLSL
jgi:UPF0755 protein